MLPSVLTGRSTNALSATEESRALENGFRAATSKKVSIRKNQGRLPAPDFSNHSEWNVIHRRGLSNLAVAR
jgi:hypothetical protein